MNDGEFDFSQPDPLGDDDPLYTDEHGVPMLFDVVIPGDYLKAAGIRLTTREIADAPAPQPAAPAEDIEARLQAAIDAALPAATERVAAIIRESLSRELHQALAGAVAAAEPTPRPDNTPPPTQLKWRDFRDSNGNP